MAGARYRRTGGQAGVVRWGQQRGSVYLADQKLPIPVPRVRDRAANREVSLTTYAQLQRPRAADAGLFRKVLVGLTCRQYEACAEAVPAAFGLSASSVSRRLDRDEFVAVVLDGKTFAEDAMVIALGITLQGQKQILGFVQTATENERSVRPSCASCSRVAYGLTTASSVSSTEPRGCAQPFRRCSAPRPLSNAVRGTSVRTSCGICRPLSRRLGVGDTNRPTSDSRRPRLEQLWADSARSCGGSTSLPWPAWTKAWRRR